MSDVVALLGVSPTVVHYAAEAAIQRATLVPAPSVTEMAEAVRGAVDTIKDSTFLGRMLDLCEERL